MADPNVVNIKSLPRVEEVVNGNLLIVENEQGTNTIDFNNFVVGPNNVSFYSQITNLSSQIISLSSSTSTQVNNLSSSLNSQISGVYTTIKAVTSTIIQSFSAIFYQANSVIIPAGQSAPTSSISFTVPTGVSIGPNDINLNFGSTVAATVGSGMPYAYLATSDFTQTLNVITFTPRLTFAPIASTPITLRWNVFKAYSVS